MEWEFNNSFQLMFGWLSRCWGGMGVNSQFERARIRSVIADWQVPDDNDVRVLIDSFKGGNPQIQPQTALNMFLSHLEMSEQKSNPLFLLKHLYVLDHTLEEGVAMQHIAGYTCSQFFIFKQGSSIQFNPLRELVAAYFLYIKKKAEVYWQFEPKYYAIKKSERESVVATLSFAGVFGLIDKCFQVQKGINQMNSKYKSHDKSTEIIQMVFTMLFKTYLFCYSLVSFGAKVLFSRVKKLNKLQTNRFYKFIKFYNKEYTRNMVDFIESNKEIYEFKSMKYSQIILIDTVYVQYLETYLHKLDNQPAALSGPEVINFQEENQVLSLPEDLDILDNILITYQHKKMYKLPEIDHDLELEFYEYTNFYSDAYESDLQSSKRHEYNYHLATNPNASLEVPTSIATSRSLSASKRLEFEAGVGSTPFKEDIWNDWKNVYSS